MHDNLKITTIAICGTPRSADGYLTHLELYRSLVARGIKVVIDQSIAHYLEKIPQGVFYPCGELEKIADLFMIVGGDGNMLKQAVKHHQAKVPMIGINRGNLGFLAEIAPDQIDYYLDEILERKNYYIEPRSLLAMGFLEANEQPAHSQQNFALNEICLTSSAKCRIVECDVYIDKRFAFKLRSDGLIISTPTGSTAYNLSAGGPIVHSSLDCMILTPVNAHSLTSRPVVIPGNSEICLKFKQDATLHNIEVYSDGNLIKTTKHDEEVKIKLSDRKVYIMHHKDFDYYQVLANKLNWAKSLF